VALLLDDIGIPATAKGRLAIADKIIEKSKEFNIDKSRFLFDALTMTVATDSESGNKTLECVKELTSRGLFTTLGVSNISFGMPNREIINASFLGAAIARGLTAAIINPASETAQTVLNEESPNPDFVYEYEGAEINVTAKENAKLTLFDAVFYGMKAQAKEAAEELLQTKQPLEIIEEQLIPALNALGKGYENKTLFLPRLLGGAESAKAAFSAINQAQGIGGQQQGKTVIMATVKGDIHDIGKNIVVTLLSNYGFRVIDMGKDVSPADILEKAKAEKADLVGLSALMTTTVPAMEETVALLHAQLPNIKVMVGGAVLTQEYATLMGADFYGTDAMSAVKFAQGI
ncbi:MAG: cobalamin-dependent protein, partial [Clostridia bacterium]|nr:cobalamin-dependent protein [Clostridia bacterium]